MADLHQFGRHDRQEQVAQVAKEVLAQGARVVTVADGVGHGAQGQPGVGVDEGPHEVTEVDPIGQVASGGGEQFERREGVARRPPALGEGGIEHLVAEVEAGIAGDPADVLGQGVARQQVELQVLGAGPDGVLQTLRVGGGEHEHHVGRRFLEHLQQGGRRSRPEHVDLVEDVHLVAARRAEGHLLDELSDVVDGVVRRRVELEHVVTGATLDRQARVAFAARLAVDGCRAVEHLGEDAGRGRLAGAARPGEKVGLALPTGAHRLAQCPHDVVLALQLAESPWSIAAVERLGGHVRSHYR